MDKKSKANNLLTILAILLIVSSVLTWTLVLAIILLSDNNVQTSKDLNQLSAYQLERQLIAQNYYSQANSKNDNIENLTAERLDTAITFDEGTQQVKPTIQNATTEIQKTTPANKVEDKKESSTNIEQATSGTREPKEEKPAEIAKETKDISNVSPEFKAALNKAQIYSDMMYLSKNGLFKQLTSEYGEKFPEDAAKYAIDNINVDWKQNALKKAENYSIMYLSKKGLYKQLVSSAGENFTETEAQYAIDNIVVD